MFFFFYFSREFFSSDSSSILFDNRIVVVKKQVIYNASESRWINCWKVSRRRINGKSWAFDMSATCKYRHWFYTPSSIESSTNVKMSYEQTDSPILFFFVSASIKDDVLFHNLYNRSFFRLKIKSYQLKCKKKIFQTE